MEALAKNLRAWASENSSNYCEQFEQRPTSAIPLLLNRPLHDSVICHRINYAGTQAFKTKESLAGLVRLPLFWKFHRLTLCKGPIACFLKLYSVCLLYDIILNVQVSEVCLIYLGHAYIEEHTFILAYIILLREMLTVNIITDCNISIIVFSIYNSALSLIFMLY